MSAPLIAGNWKMNGVLADLGEAGAVAAALGESPAKTRVAICPPATLLAPMARALGGSAVLLGGQDCHAEISGAFTGDVSAAMLADAGAKLVIVGHSERRAMHGESDAMVAAKASAAARAELEPIVCIGESLEERKGGNAAKVVSAQIAGSIPADFGTAAFCVAYEPIWAIGSGLTPTLAEIEDTHGAIRAALVLRLGKAGETTPILYGGSVKPANAAEILAVNGVGGALVGGASLKAQDFLGIIRGA